MNWTYLKNYMDELAAERTPGNAIEIYVDGKSVFRCAAGYSDLEKKTQMTGDEYFYIYSASKIATVTAALQLLEQGKYLLNDPLYYYIPEFGDMTIKKENGEVVKAENPITIANLFTMTAGFDYDTDRKAFAFAREKTNGKMDTVEVVRALAAEPLCFEPGTHWQYGQGLDIMGAVVQVTSGMTLGEFMKKEIFEPLGMKDTGYRFNEDILSRLVECTKRDAEGKLHYHTSDKLDALSRPDCIYEGASTGLHSTLGDYTKFAMMLANGGRLGDAQILGRKTIDLMRRNQLTDAQLADFHNGAYRSGYGYGLGVRTMMDPAAGGSNGSVGEFGWSGYLGTWVAVDPEEKTSIVYMHQTLPNLEETVHPRIRAVANGLFR